MTPKQQRFVDEYLIDLNATQAYIRAGYSAATAQPGSARLLSTVMVQEAVAAGQQAHAERVDLTVDWVLQQLRDVVAYGMQKRDKQGNLSESGNLLTDVRAATTAAQLIGKHLGMWPNTVSVYDYREQAQRAADALGIDVEEVLAEAKRLTEGK